MVGCVYSCSTASLYKKDLKMENPTPSMHRACTTLSIKPGHRTFLLYVGADLPLEITPANPALLPKIEEAQFRPYLQACSSRLSKFESARNRRVRDQQTEEESSFTPGDGLAEALCVVPAMFFKEDFSLARQPSQP